MNNINPVSVTEIPVFFAVDDNYAPLLGVALTSISENMSKRYRAKVHVLSTSLSEKNRELITRSAGKNCTVSFTDVSDELARLGVKLHLRDYYTATTYYRFFIAELFPEYDKALYLDCDIVVNGDIGELYSIRLGNNLVGAIVEEVMQKVDVFGTYVEKVLEIPREVYFNAGVLVMNLDEIRKCDVKREFVRLIGKKRFEVTQDQDYLNVICYGKRVCVGLEWNKTPMPDAEFEGVVPKLVHYKINWKPWHYENVLYSDDFWKYAKKNVYYNDILRMFEEYTDEERERDGEAYINLYNLAIRECENADAEKCVKV